MDRFIDELSTAIVAHESDLKSSLDRFIDLEVCKQEEQGKRFKIQFG